MALISCPLQMSVEIAMIAKHDATQHKSIAGIRQVLFINALKVPLLQIELLGPLLAIVSDPL